MDTKLCRICGRLGTTHQNIFKIEGLKHKIETCLPIFVTQHCLLPDTICEECITNIKRYFHFIKDCLQSIIVLESQYDLKESCLKSKRRHDKGCMVDFSNSTKTQDTQTEDKYDILFTKYNEENSENTKLPFLGCDIKLVDYEVESEASETDNYIHTPQGRVTVINAKSNQKKVDDFLDHFLATKSKFTREYFDNFENKLISEILQRKSAKRKGDNIEKLPLKICKLEIGNRRKSKVPKKIDNVLHLVNKESLKDTCEKPGIPSESFHEQSFENPINIVETVSDISIPQLCLLCERQFSGPSALAAHIFEVHDIDFNAVVENSYEKKKRIPNLLKISDIKRSNSLDDNQSNEPKSPTNQHFTVCQGQVSSEHCCQICQYSTSTKHELYSHCRSEHLAELPLMCGICYQPATTMLNLKTHLAICVMEYPVTTRYFCAICKYGEDTMRNMEGHVLVHDFLIDMCKREVRMFDPADYVELNPSCESGPISPSSNSLTCNLCFQSNFQSFKEFSYHRRKEHCKFHCDLCNKFYGRNSHLWKHVNRLHKNHPSITCQICYKTSASKYHLGQHFSKSHCTKLKTPSVENNSNDEVTSKPTEEQFIFRKFQTFEFRSKEQNISTNQKKSESSEFDEISNNATSDQEIFDEVFVPSENITVPKEVDASSDLYTNIITNYTPPPNGGEFKCPKCSKGFSQKILLKKHKKNCRPKLQKDLLTRCKTCARIFKDRQSLAKHLVNYHSEYTCEICSQKSQSKCEIVSHIRSVHPNCMLFCQICGKILRSKQNLADHLKDHSNSFVCQFCGDLLPNKIKLKMHILSLHRKILSLSCGICLKLFESQHILRNHVQLVHKNDLRPFTSCTVCGKNYGSKWKTYDHVNKSHGLFFKVCKTCLEIFDNEEQLYAHCEEMHSMKNQNVLNVKNSQFNTTTKHEFEETNDSDELDDHEDNENGTENIFSNFTSEMSGVSKISLLERRLLGKTVTNEEPEGKTVKLSENKCITDKLKSNNGKSKTKKSLDLKLEEDIQTQQSTSKRTVYVNSNVPSLCEICFKTWPAKKHLWQHYIRCHKSVAATVCGICLKTNVDYRSLQQHLRSNHPTLLHGQGFGSNFICRICGRYHNASSKLKLHMAIHENFDWSILDVLKDENKTTNGEECSSEENPTYEENDRYFESLIEQVECSSDEEDDEKEKENDEKNDSSSSSDLNQESESDSASESEVLNEEVGTNSQFGTCEETMKNEMFAVNASGAQTEFHSSGSDESSSESDSSESADEINDEVGDRSNTRSSNDASMANGLENSNSDVFLEGDSMPYADIGMYRFKTEELDSAVKSISYECEEVIKQELEIEYCELPLSSSLNEREIESAVGSIL